ncbi:biotin--[acetyl-CoA-carboxylase] ligase [Fusibacter ferrireducens]|uniref:Bifunctional ligase/repressor BirA n=1 Tax=Fusibacter ferrireducens TaxID=2785058 RepID=A0ABS0A044_9FIRM|nr:biotin--[acetyl-CoA-carboxylase] ligase [Fusibacter ferrireducens]MBF4695596.1 biotin--[acetyl-CoA-carboxylase] ligase [Fusibacter ferrireducens]
MKAEIMSLLRAKQGEYVSGEEISKQLNVSRTSVWKYINMLRSEGYEISSVTNKGYRLVSDVKELNEVELKYALKECSLVQECFFFDTIDSTNQKAKSIGNGLEFQQCLIVSNEQTKGRGRLGRQWDSEKGAGIWMSLLLKPDFAPDLASRITLMAAAAMSEAIEIETGIETAIKWPNDIVVNGKKVCGILTELNAELNHINYLVLGIGVNVNTRQFDAEIQEKATSLSLELNNQWINRLNIIKLFVEKFEIYYNQFVNENDFRPVIEYNRRKSITLNKDVEIISGNTRKKAFALDIDMDGNLIVKNSDGSNEAIYYGEVSVRGINGYV